jgi:peptidoglycan hydrolase CwlO-like protein
MTMSNTTQPKSVVHALRAARRVTCLILTAVLVLVLDAGVVNADPVEPLKPSSDYSATLNSQIAAIGERIASLPRREADINAQQTALDPRIAAYNQQSKDVLAQLDVNGKKINDHNAQVAGYPNGAPPGIADALNAESQALNSEQQRLKAEANAIADEGDAIKAEQQQLKTQKEKLDSERSTLPAERQKLLQRMAAALQALIQTAPATVHQAPGGDPARPPGSASQGQHTQGNGGDPVSRKSQGAALDAYANSHGVTVDKRPLTARLSPEAVSKLSPSEAANLTLLRAFDGLVRKPNGNYKALDVTPAGAQPAAAQKAFDDATARGGPATAVVDGKKITIDEVEQVTDPTAEPEACPTPNSFAPGTPVLLADGNTRPIEQITPGTQVRATDPATGRTTAEPVLAQIIGSGQKQLDELTISDGQQSATVTATAGHPFWDPAQRAWVTAGDLRPGTALASLPDSSRVHVTDNRAYQETLTVHNLTIANTHTYYVLAGKIPLLVHNDGKLCGSGPVPGVIELSDRVKSSAAFKNYFPKGGGVEYVFDPKTSRLAAGMPAPYLRIDGSPHQQLARSINADETKVLGGTLQRGKDGSFGFTENSGHYGDRWTPELVQQFKQFLTDYGIRYTYTPWAK